jgi:hypothetical protein
MRVPRITAQARYVSYRFVSRPARRLLHGQPHSLRRLDDEHGIAAFDSLGRCKRIAHAAHGEVCSASGACDAASGLYLDDSPVPYSGQKLFASTSSTASDHVVLTGIVTNVSAGAHVIKYATTFEDNWSSAVLGGPSLTAVLLGGASVAASTSGASKTIFNH